MVTSITTRLINNRGVLDQMNLQPLYDAGLTPNEALIYNTLINNHTLSCQEITAKTGIHRRNVYDALSRLLEKGLVNESLVNNKKQFNPVHPSRLLNLLEEKKHNISSLMPALLDHFTHTKKRNIVRIYQGIEGAKASFTESLAMMKKGDSYYAIGCIDMREILGPFMDEHHKERQKKKIISWALFNHTYKDRAKLFKNKKDYHVRVLPKGYYLPVQTVVYGKDIVCQMMIHDEPFVIQVIDEEFASNYKKYFDMLWKIAK